MRPIRTDIAEALQAGMTHAAIVPGCVAPRHVLDAQEREHNKSTLTAVFGGAT